MNPKEYFKVFESESVNKKQKGLRKQAKGADFERYSKRINSVVDIEKFGQLPVKKQKQSRFTIKKKKHVA